MACCIDLISSVDQFLEEEMLVKWLEHLLFLEIFQLGSHREYIIPISPYQHSILSNF